MLFKDDEQTGWAKKVASFIYESNKDNLLVVIAGPTASGKDSVAKALAENYNYFVIPTVTTRPRRSNEFDENVVFFSDDMYQKAEDEGCLAYSRTYYLPEADGLHVVRYGYLEAELSNASASSCVITTTQVAKAMREDCGGDVFGVFMTASEDTRRKRYMARGGDSETTRAQWELRADNEASREFLGGLDGFITIETEDKRC